MSATKRITVQHAIDEAFRDIAGRIRDISDSDKTEEEVIEFLTSYCDKPKTGIMFGKANGKTADKPAGKKVTQRKQTKQDSDEEDSEDDGEDDDDDDEEPTSTKHDVKKLTIAAKGAGRGALGTRGKGPANRARGRGK